MKSNETHRQFNVHVNKSLFNYMKFKILFKNTIDLLCYVDQSEIQGLNNFSQSKLISSNYDEDLFSFEKQSYTVKVKLIVDIKLFYFNPKTS